MDCGLCHKKFEVANIVQCWCEQLLCVWCAESHVESCTQMPAQWRERIEARIRDVSSSHLTNQEREDALRVLEKVPYPKENILTK